MGRVAFSTQIEGFDRRVRALLEAFSAPDIERSAVLNAVVEELSTSLEELKVAEEELAAQNLELESAHASVQAERRRYREFFMSAQEGYLVTDHKGIIVEGNPAAGQLLGASLANLPGKPLATFVVANERAEFQQWLRRIADRELSVATHEEAHVNTLGRERSFRCAFTFWRTDEGQPTGPTLRWALQDLTDRDRARERDRFEEQAVRRDEFLAVLAHELRNPLAAITLASAQLTRKVEPADERMTRAAETVKRHTAQLTRLIDDLIDVSRVYHGKITLDCQLIELSELVAGAVSTVQPALRVKRHLLSVDRDAEPLWVKADPLRLQQVLVNLLDNAAKYTPDGGRIEVRMRRSGGRGVVAVRDFGIGIPPDMIDHIFGLFEQGSGGASGLGIGLTLVRELLKMHGGIRRGLQRRHRPGQRVRRVSPAGACADRARRESDRDGEHGDAPGGGREDPHRQRQPGRCGSGGHGAGGAGSHGADRLHARIRRRSWCPAAPRRLSTWPCRPWMASSWRRSCAGSSRASPSSQ